MKKDIAIQVNKIGKVYQIGKHNPYSTLRDLLSSSFIQNEKKNTIWALKDLSFKIERGSVVGIIGKNGSGKTTLLKILSRITYPSTGKATIRGKVASLLEVGTGFSPELTGRENTYLNGSILGMTQKEIKRKFDEIVHFSGVEKFIDTPVKRYSSGMYVRLAFAVAAHLEPEILLVDEVLAVGDIEFQRKCLKKMDDLTKKQGRTILFVSHNMNAIDQLCSRAILLEDGKMIEQGPVGRVINTYIAHSITTDASSAWTQKGNILGNQFFRPEKFFITDENFKPVKVIRSDNTSAVIVEFQCEEILSNLMIGYRIFDEDNRCIYITTHTDTSPQEWPPLQIGKNTIYSHLPKRLLKEGRYRLELIAKPHDSKWIIGPGDNTPTIYITIQGGSSDSPYWSSRKQNLVVPIIKWGKR